MVVVLDALRVEQSDASAKTKSPLALHSLQQLLELQLVLILVLEVAIRLSCLISPYLRTFSEEPAYL